MVVEPDTSTIFVLPFSLWTVMDELSAPTIVPATAPPPSALAPSPPMNPGGPPAPLRPPFWSAFCISCGVALCMRAMACSSVGLPPPAAALPPKNPPTATAITTTAITGMSHFFTPYPPCSWSPVSGATRT